MGSTNGVIAHPWDSCIACAAGTYSYVDPASEIETAYTRVIHNKGIYDIEGGCRSCPAFSSSVAQSGFAADCKCLAGYMCFARDIPCKDRLADAFVALSHRICTVSLRETWRRRALDGNLWLGSDIKAGPFSGFDVTDYRGDVSTGYIGATNWTVASTVSVCGGGGVGNASRYKPYSPVYQGISYNASNFTCAEHLPELYTPNRELALCEDVDECALETHSCNPQIHPLDWAGPSATQPRCVNTFGSFACLCARGYKTGMMAPDINLTEGGMPLECIDQDECSEMTHNCHPDASCTNTDGSYTCTCNRYFKGDGVVDCWDGMFECRPAVKLAVKTASGSACWARLSNLTSETGGPDLPSYCDDRAGTTDKVFVSLFWLESQSWSEERQFMAGDGHREIAPDLRVGAEAEGVLSGLLDVGTPAMIRYRVEGNDAWHPESIHVNKYNDPVRYSVGVHSGMGTLASSGRLLDGSSVGSDTMCWVDGDSCVAEGVCYTMYGSCGSVGPSAEVDIDECELNVHNCDVNATCVNLDGRYRCDCAAGFYGVGTKVMGSGTECLQCPAGKYSGVGAIACTPCPDYPLSSGPQGSPSVELCACRPGFYGNLSARPVDRIVSFNITGTGSGYSDGAEAIADCTGITGCWGYGFAGTCAVTSGEVTSISITDFGSYNAAAPPMVTCATGIASVAVSGFAVTAYKAGGAASAVCTNTSGCTGSGFAGSCTADGIASILVNSGGSNYTSGGNASLDCSGIGGCMGSGFAGICQTDGGMVTGVAVTNPGSGYVASALPSITCSGGTGLNATVSLGAVTSITVTSSGSGYRTSALPLITCAGGSGQTFTSALAGGGQHFQPVFETHVPNITCQECPKNSYCPGGVRTSLNAAYARTPTEKGQEKYACPANSSSPRLRHNITDCVCNQGFYGLNGEKCVMCPPGSVCIGGWFKQTCAEGEYAAAYSTACKTCQANSTSAPSAGFCECDGGFATISSRRLITNGTCYLGGCSPVQSQSLCTAAGAALALGIGNGEAQVIASNASGHHGCFWNSSAVQLQWIMPSTAWPGNPEEDPGLLCTEERPCLCDDCSERQCSACPSGSYAASGATTCSTCPLNSATGTFPAYSIDDCVCATAFYLNPSTKVCDACPKDATSILGSTSAYDCGCRPGYSGNASLIIAGQSSCLNSTLEGKSCIFPFTFAGQQYSTCTFAVGPGFVNGSVNTSLPAEGFQRAWCATDDTPVSREQELAWNGTAAQDWYGECNCSGLCTKCPAGTFKSLAGDSPCLECEAGKYSGDAAVECSPCPALTTSLPRSIGEGDCYCVTGYIQNASSVVRHCIDEDECASGNSSCSADATCNNTVGSFTCSCNPGYHGNGSVCESCAAGYKCAGGMSQPQMCLVGSYSKSTASVCTLCPGNATSMNASDSCNCRAGFLADPQDVNNPRMLTTSNSSCVNENECLTGAHNCDPQATCTDTAGSFTCECSQQFPCEQDPCDGTVGQCVATCGDGVRGGNETCDDGNNDAGDGCENCVQMSGWNCSSTSKPEVCTNIDECTLPIDDPRRHDCHTNASCTDTQGSFSCVCDANFFGDGTACTRCAPHSFSDANASTELECICGTGFYRGVTNATVNASAASYDYSFACLDSDECLDGTHSCGFGSYCNNTFGSFQCVCLPNFKAPDNTTTGDFQCEDRDECEDGTNNCDDNAWCNNTVGSFTCACNIGYYDDTFVNATDENSTVIGAYSNVTGTSCQICSAGTYSAVHASTSCSTCPGNATSVAGSSSLGNCSCNAGYAGVFAEDGGECVQCGAGFFAETGQASCCACAVGASSLPGSVAATDCFCDYGYYGGFPQTHIVNGNGTCDTGGLVCDACPYAASSPQRSSNRSDCFCVSGFYYSVAENSTEGNCTACEACELSGYARVGCVHSLAVPGTSPGTCVDIDECSATPGLTPADGTSDCDANAHCHNLNQSYTCECKAGYYGNGTHCQGCPAFATSANASSDVTNCSCMMGFDIGDGETQKVYSADDICTVTMEVTIVTAGATPSQCLPVSSSHAEYCDRNAGTQNDVWLRMQWGVGMQTPLRFNAFGARVDSGYFKREVMTISGATADAQTQERTIDAGTAQFEVTKDSDDNIHDSILACNVVFPSQANLSEGTLWQFWGNEAPSSPGKGAKAWLGLRKCQPTDAGCNGTSFYFLRARAGKGHTDIVPTFNDTSDAKDNPGEQVWIDTTDFPRDGQPHQVVVQVMSRPLRLNLWIDGVSRGTHALNTPPDQDQYFWTSALGTGNRPGSGSYGVYPSRNPEGEVSDPWPGGLSALMSGLRIFARTSWVGCTASILDGDFVAGPLDELDVYCPPTASVGAPVWSAWYALYQEGTQNYDVPVEPGRGFDFAAGKTAVALFAGIPGDVLGEPIAVEYYVSGSDAWRPESVTVRFRQGVPLHGIRDRNFSTRGQLCWVDADGQSVDQSALGCHIVGQSAKATMFEESFSPSSTGAVAVGLHSSPTTPESVYALLAHDQEHRPAPHVQAETPGQKPGIKYVMQSEGHREDWGHEGEEIEEVQEEGHLFETKSVRGMEAANVHDRQSTVSLPV